MFINTAVTSAMT